MSQVFCAVVMPYNCLAFKGLPSNIDRRLHIHLRHIECGHFNYHLLRLHHVQPAHLPSTQTPGKMSHFEPNAILRGAQLTVVGALRALKNPGLFTSEHYKQAALAVLAGIVIRLLVAIPVRL
jgi:hypothetical protein